MESGEKSDASSIRPPLADRMRPRTIDDVVGQDHLTAPNRILRQALEVDTVPSMILWGPPGCGKTTLAHVISNHTACRFEAVSAVFSGVRDLKAIASRAREARRLGRGLILFVDEIHRFNKSQQDAFLPYVEDGTLTLVGATTENPSFSLNSALLSRCRVLTLNALGGDHLLAVLRNALEDDERGFGTWGVKMSEDLLPRIARESAGDARYSLNMLETFLELSKPQIEAGETLDDEMLSLSLERRAALYDRAGDGHYNLISAFHKSLRGSDPDASLYWLARMMQGGEDGLYVARRMIRFASEDIGNADPDALAMAIRARDSFHFLGKPEGELALAQAAVYLATAPKSNSLYIAYKKALKAAKETGELSPPRHILNAPTTLMKGLGYGKGYRYAHDYESGFVAQEYLPEPMSGAVFYQPVERGFEREVAKRLRYWQGLKAEQEKGSEEES
ncbi:MAG: replication-associated recombination protein A [Magnetococcales bacterium]|nr:replication-associated recombination protein A [Magnetococcales bacterium]